MKHTKMQTLLNKVSYAKIALSSYHYCHLMHSNDRVLSYGYLTFPGEMRG